MEGGFTKRYDYALQTLRDLPYDRWRANLDRFSEVLELEPFLETPVRQLSLGQRMRGELTAAMLHDPEVLIMDEPTSGLDPNQIRGVRTLIRELGKSKTVLVSTHILQEVEPVADKFRSFGWWAEDVDGHDMEALVAVLEAARAEPERPKAIVCHTRLGAGVPLIMNREKAHFVRVEQTEWDRVAAEVESS